MHLPAESSHARTAIAEGADRAHEKKPSCRSPGASPSGERYGATQGAAGRIALAVFRPHEDGRELESSRAWIDAAMLRSSSAGIR